VEDDLSRLRSTLGLTSPLGRTRAAARIQNRNAPALEIAKSLFPLGKLTV
jgi:hypothetical protein